MVVELARRTALLAVAVSATLGFSASAAQAATFNVSRTDDPAPGACISGVDCSLREAIVAANADGVIDTINLPAGTYSLTSTLTQIDQGVTIAGASASSTVVRQTADQERVLTTGAAPGLVTLSRVTVTGGRLTGLARGGGIQSNGSGGLSLVDSVVRDNRVTGNDVSVAGGGGIHVAATGPLTLTRTVVRGNRVLRSGTDVVNQARGAGIYNGAGGPVTITDSTIDGNSISMALPALNSTVSGGGGIFNLTGSMTITRSRITNNSVSLSQGTQNVAGGGGIHEAGGGTLSLTDSTVSGNKVTVTGGSALGGGGIFRDTEGSSSLFRTTVSGNSVTATHASLMNTGGGGGLYSNTSTPPTIANSTISDNRYTSTGAGGTGGGGLRLNAGSPVPIQNTTIAGNSTNRAGGGINGNSVQLDDSIISSNSPANCTGAFTSLGDNVESANSCGLGGGDQPNTDPRLGPLAGNGGLTLTRALLPGSPAIDAVNAGCPAADQRGVARQGLCDAGAYEFDGLSFASLPSGCAPDGRVPVTLSAAPGRSAVALRFRVDSGATQRLAVRGSPPTAVVSLGTGSHRLEYWGEFSGGYEEAAHHLQTIASCAVTPLGPPVLGRTVNLEPVSGDVYVSVPGPQGLAKAGRRGARSSAYRSPIKGRRFIPVTEARLIPVKSLIDARKGRVRLTSALLTKGKTQAGVFYSGVFQVLQSRRKRSKGLAELRLKGGNFRKRCGRKRKKRRARRSSAQPSADASRRKRRLRRRTVRRLRGRAKGRYRTRGRHSSATVRGTTWSVTDRCDGTLTKVSRGKVVVRDFRRKKKITLRRGKRYLAKAPG